MAEAFENIQSGDKVLISSRYGGRIETVDKVTPTGRIKIGSTYYDKNGWKVGASTWNHSSIKKATDKDIERIMQKKTITEAIYEMRNQSSVTYEQAVAILEILKTKEETHEQT